jgi:ATP-dependent Lhr-like helicase
LKNGELKGLIATSSLELGIDVGRIDLVIQYMSPRQVTRLIQRVGRAGHTYGHASQGVIICMDSDDTLEALVIARRALREELEPVEIPPKPFDALAHQIAGLLLKTRRLDFAEILTRLRMLTLLRLTLLTWKKSSSKACAVSAAGEVALRTRWC